MELLFTCIVCVVFLAIRYTKSGAPIPSQAQLPTFLSYSGVALCAVALCVMAVRRQWNDYWPVGVFLVVQAVGQLVLAILMREGKERGVGAAYQGYVYSSRAIFALESVLLLVIIYRAFRLAMAPLKGLQSLGMLVFRWAAAISVVVALGLVFVRPLTEGSLIEDGLSDLAAGLSKLQQTLSILTFCLLLFVWFSARAMGLSYRGKIFGVTVGVGLLALANLIFGWSNDWWPEQRSHVIFDGVPRLLALTIWTVYLAIPEPKRRMIMLPTTSPFLRWNEISLALQGTPPGTEAESEPESRSGRLL